MPITRHVADMIAEAKATVPQISPQDAAAMQQNGEAVLIDIRDARELAKAGRIADAVHAPRGMLEFLVDPNSPAHKEVFATDKQLVIVCASGGRSALSAKTLMDMGLDNVQDMEGGFSGWAKIGLPIVKDE